VVRASVVRDGRTALLEIELNPGKSNRARVNRAALPRARELLGIPVPANARGHSLLGAVPVEPTDRA